MIPAGALRVLDNHNQRYPQLANDQSTLKLQYAEKLWHQVADELLRYCKQDCFSQLENDTGLIDLYNEMVKDLHTRVNPLKYAQISVLCCVQIQDLDEAFDFLGQASERVKHRKDATYFLRIAQAEKRLD